MVQEIAVRQALPQCLWGSFEFVVKMAFLDWEAAVLPLNYARDRSPPDLAETARSAKRRIGRFAAPEPLNLVRIFRMRGFAAVL
jgi:hypothetical protein